MHGLLDIYFETRFKVNFVYEIRINLCNSLCAAEVIDLQKVEQNEINGE